MQYFRAG